MMFISIRISRLLRRNPFLLLTCRFAPDLDEPHATPLCLPQPPTPLINHQILPNSGANLT